jgi:hypothetical protein
MEAAGMRFAYADPPYLGCGRLYAKYHPDALIWDDPETHRHLIERLSDEWPDGWALSLHTPSLRTILPMCPADVRVAAWVKPFAVFKPGVPIGAESDDTLDDLFPGTGAVGAAWAQRVGAPPQMDFAPLFSGAAP